MLYTTITLYDGFENVNCCHQYPYLDIGAKVGAEINRHNNVISIKNAKINTR